MTKRVPHKLAIAALAVVTLTGTAKADWHDQITRYDVAASRSSRTIPRPGPERSRRRGGTGDIRAVQRLFAPEPRSVPERRSGRNWRCRQMKLGGMTGYYVFDWFRCRITRVNGQLWFEKTGTQRMAGYLYPSNGMWIYLGAQSARGEPIASLFRQGRLGGRPRRSRRSGRACWSGSATITCGSICPSRRTGIGFRRDRACPLVCDGMKLNQVTLPAMDLAASIAFYEKLGFVLIVRNDHYARFENPSDLSTLSLELRAG